MGHKTINQSLIYVYFVSTQWGRETHICGSELDLFDASHELYRCWLMVNLNTRYKFQCNHNHKIKLIWKCRLEYLSHSTTKIFSQISPEEIIHFSYVVGFLFHVLTQHVGMLRCFIMWLNFQFLAPNHCYWGCNNCLSNHQCDFSSAAKLKLVYPTFQLVLGVFGKTNVWRWLCRVFLAIN